MKTYGYLPVLQKFNLLTNECEGIKSSGYQPKGRMAHKSIILKDIMYVFGGWSVENYLQDMLSINLSNN